MNLKLRVTFPATCGQWAGDHWFNTFQDRDKFMVRASTRGAPVHLATYASTPAKAITIKRKAKGVA